MADFSTHVFGAAAIASLGATCATKLFSLSMQEGTVLLLVGVLGGVLPDLDLNKSRPSQALFAVIGVLLALAWLAIGIHIYTALESWLFTLVIFFLVRYPIAAAFHRLTTHRGVLHSMIAAVMSGVVSCAAAWQFFETTALQAWLIGFSMTTGYLVHLLLDELYSVDFAGGRVKRTFGSAMKPIDLKRPRASCLVALLTVAALYCTPPTTLAFGQMNERLQDWRPALIPRWL